MEEGWKGKAEGDSAHLILGIEVLSARISDC